MNTQSSPSGLREIPVPNNSLASAFTLVELLVAMGVLSLILVLLLQVVNSVLATTTQQIRQIDAVASARRAMDIITMDMKAALTTDQCSIVAPTTPNGLFLVGLLTARRGPVGSADHRFLAVRYALDSRELIRLTASVPSTSRDLFATLFDTPALESEVLVPGILDVRFLAVDESGVAHRLDPASPSLNWATTNYGNSTLPADSCALVTKTPSFAANLTNRTHSLEVWIAAVGEQDRDFLADGAYDSALQTVFTPAATPEMWRDSIDARGDLPSRLKSGIRILTKTIPLP